MLVWTAGDVQSDNRTTGLVMMTTVTSLQGKLSGRLADSLTVVPTTQMRELVDWLSERRLIFSFSPTFFKTIQVWMQM